MKRRRDTEERIIFQSDSPGANRDIMFQQVRAQLTNDAGTSPHPVLAYLIPRLQVQTNKRMQLIRSRVPMTVPTRPNERWSMVFVNDQLTNGGWFRV